MKKKKVGEILRDQGKISPADLEMIIAEQQGKVIHLGELMLERGLIGKEDLAGALEEVSRVPYMDCTKIVVEPAAIKLIPRVIAERHCALPIRIDHKSLVVAMATPQNVVILDELRFISGLDISPRLAFRTDVQAAIDKHYLLEPGQKRQASGSETPGQAREELEFFSDSSRQSNQETVQEIQADLRQKKTPAVRLVSEIIKTAMAKDASDIHIEPRATETAVRIRVDGVLRDLQSIPRAIHNPMVSRIKILSDMDISERRTSQDGRFMVSVGARKIDLRVSTLPTQYGEKVVIRLLETSAPLTSFCDLGIPADTSEGLSELLALPQGMILVTGPTGSGKSTTLYSALHKLRKPSVNIVTIEDPIEYVLPDINQSPVNTKAGMTFASCLRSILRQDPNIIMVGEIRDRETAEIAMKASQTGHFVLSTLHTNDSVAAIVRLLDLGIPGFLINSSVTGILSQRLVRKLCSCHSVQPVRADYQVRLVQAGVQKLPTTMAVPMGCDHCDQTGYKGRLGVYELLRFDESIRNIIRTSGNIDQIRNTSRANGMRTMQEDAIEKVRCSLTTLEEVQRVVPMESVSSVECTECGCHIFATSKFCSNCGTRCSFDPQSSRARDQILNVEGVFQT
jgi:type IV pilus assembly protein PilB